MAGLHGPQGLCGCTRTRRKPGKGSTGKGEKVR